ncbi:phosphoglucosamine mutase [Neoehrlichia mikurensis]|uniref:Phosphoglucosamine mutase n=1 Tax=Neoehrlichia mikurensis TaxID=89586 RepID=A0A9Q9BYY1_9RICK|nr:phosphoglucosamine mutase [Neoehrlichia mikurensis]QXK91767.1 phosphoglucosamine mutase [Neoehrlichia mikurensis]QXK92980.1 phosphoglucosamine mutase [Neoehrlichia mikurensis]QXK93457.1 phosphoglucosamine mutase [Neoehrlichia mikurensis]UTO55588.1 phosphoglucosamine mutase [Neoehrlichia mikurensis]UTO56509.1 phosphoglucosamine mutase [Neoehrlichia mikurensis]
MIKSIFGTDGIRGKVNSYPMKAETILKLGMAVGAIFKGINNRVVIGRDTRISGYMLEAALVSGLTSIGMDVNLVGEVPTATVAMLVKHLNADVGLVLSGSHNPYCDNGIKIFDNKGFKLSVSDEQLIESKMMENLDYALTSPEKIGKVSVVHNASEYYINFVINTFSKGLDVSNIKVVLDCANGAAYHVSKKIFSKLGLDVIFLSDRPDGFNINENCGSSYPENIVQVVKKENANIGISLDGDADRIVICDEKGNVIDGDQVIAAIAKYNSDKVQNLGVVVTIMSSLSLDKYMENLGIRLYRCAIGDRHVMEMMKRYSCKVGGEKSGHIVLSDYTTTGDGLITALQVLCILTKTEKTASEVFQNFIPMFQVNKNIFFRDDFDINTKQIKLIIQDAESIIKNNGRILLRKSGTEKLVRLMVEGEDVGLIEEVASTLYDQLNKIIH